MTVPPFAGAPYQNVAGDNARVENQIGVIHQADFHYYLSQDDPPARKLEVARAHLARGTSRSAERIFADLIHDGHGTSEIAYRFALSIFSGRSLNEVDRPLVESFEDASRVAVEAPADQWTEAFSVVGEIMRGLWSQEAGKPLHPEQLQKFQKAFDGLPVERKEEITKHLEMILNGPVQDVIDAVDAQRVAKARMEGDRAGRAWKFFEADPAKPRLFVPPPTEIAAKTWVKLVLGGGVSLLGLILLFTVIAGNPAGGIFGVLLTAGGGALAVYHGIARRLIDRRLRSKQFEYTRADVPPKSPGHFVRTDFTTEIHQLMDAHFTRARPHIAGNWPADTTGVKASYKARFVALYGNAQVKAPAVSWLMRFYAKQVGDKWAAGTLYEFHRQLRSPPETNFLHGLGIAASAVGLVVFLGSGEPVFGPGILFCVGAFFVMNGLIDLVSARRFDAEAKAENQRFFLAEQQEYERWVQVLADRPSDGEMAQWLALDKSYLKTQALTRCRLSNRDLVAHVVLTEGAPTAFKARVKHGPPRYSKYNVLVFLLSAGGVREVVVRLHFLDGNIYNEERTAFNYNSVASAKISEVGVRYADDHRIIEAVGAQFHPLGTDQRISSRAFVLRLLDGADITVVAENFAGFRDDSENENELMNVALDSSGITGALHVLEAVAAEGREWITREQERRARLSREWRDSVRDPSRLDGGRTDLFGETETEEGGE